MNKAILYYSDKCSDTEPFMAQLKSLGIDYEAVNINESIPNLQAFLKLRDQREEFEPKKAIGYVGVPVLLKPDNSLWFELSE